MDPHRISSPALWAQGERGAPLRVPLLQKGNPGRNLTSLLHAAPPSLVPVALGDFLVLAEEGGEGLFFADTEDMLASEHLHQSLKYAPNDAA